jgi:hypothetical protein
MDVSGVGKRWGGGWGGRRELCSITCYSTVCACMHRGFLEYRTSVGSSTTSSERTVLNGLLLCSVCMNRGLSRYQTSAGSGTLATNEGEPCSTACLCTLCESVPRGLCKSIHLVKVLIATSVDESGAELLAPVLSQSLSFCMYRGLSKHQSSVQKYNWYKDEANKKNKTS